MFVLLPDPDYSGVITTPVYATAVAFEDADISFLGVERPGISGVDPHERAKGWLKTNYHAQMIPKEENGPTNRQTVNAFCGELNDGMVLETLDNSRFIILRGHGSEGKLYYTETQDETKTLTAGEILAYTESFEQAEVVIFGSCKSGSSNQSGGNLVNYSFYKGAACVIGFKYSLNRSLFSAFQYMFFQEYAQYCAGNSNCTSVTDIANTVYLLISENLLDYSVVIDNDNPIVPNNVYCKE